MANINWVLNVQVEGGPQIVFSNPKREVEAYGKVGVTLEDIAGLQDVDIQPSPAAQVKFLLIKAKVAATETNLTYKVSNGTVADDTEAIVLNEPHLYSEGMIGTFLPDPPKLLKFENGTGKEVVIEILVGRDATT